ncbi:HWE histidine kinase domain-containing protein [Phenylobacterium sp.]|uniref:HWE histidine kinase domain-containing protein n=1 Tax=Phenylobacterium sp. TaxID=1871053 RepID=UPI002F946E53
MQSLRLYLVSMATLLVLLLGLATALAVRQVYDFGRAQTERQLLDTTRALSLVVDAQLRSYEAMLQGLRTGGAVQDEDWAAVDLQARRLLAGRDAWIVLYERQGRQLVNTRLPPGAPLPAGQLPAEAWAVLDQGRSRVCNLANGLVERNILCVDVPVMRDGRAAFGASVIFKPQLLDRVLTGPMLREGRFATVVDRQGAVIWRNVDPDRFIGRPATADVRAAMRTGAEGVMESVSLEGVPTLVAYSRSSVSGWTFMVAVPRSQIAAPREDALKYGFALAAGFLLLGAGVGLAAGGRLTRAVGHLSAAAGRIRAGERAAYRDSGLREIDEAGRALEAAVAERDASQERFRLAQEVGGIGAWEWGVDGLGHVSDSYKEMHGLPNKAGPIRLSQVYGAIHPEDLPGYRARLAEATRRREASTNEYRVVRPDGSVRWIYAKGRPVFDESGAMTGAIGVVIDLTERKATEEQLRLLMREVDHRANNLMAVVQGAVSLSRAGDAESLREIILGRVAALARAHQLLAESRWRGADLRRLVEEELRPYTLGDRERVRISGEPLPLSPAAAQGVAMAVHELATNAAKHGALGAPDGRVDVAWEVRGERVHVVWQETGGPAVTAPSRRGFGTTVLERALGGAVGGETRLDWRAVGLRCELELPLLSPSEAAVEI